MPQALKYSDWRARQPSNLADLKSLAIKLRWIGLEDEAEGLFSHLARIAPQVSANLWLREPD